MVEANILLYIKISQTQYYYAKAEAVFEYLSVCVWRGVT